MDQVGHLQQIVCINCDHHTTGNNCEHCIDQYYRPLGVYPNDSHPCRACECNGPGATGQCVKDNFFMPDELEPGHCFCKQGFEGPNCDRCSRGYHNFPICEPCYCSLAGVIEPYSCNPPCKCKANVEGPRCDACKKGFYDLSQDNPNGCSACFCYKVTQECDSSEYGIEVISSKETLDKWLISNLDGDQKYSVQKSNNHLVVPADEVSHLDMYYWLAPNNFLGDMLATYGGYLKLNVGSIVLRGDSAGRFIKETDIIFEGEPNSTRIGFKLPLEVFDNLELIKIKIKLIEVNWFKLNSREGKNEEVSREEFALILSNLKRVLIRAKFHTDQIEGNLYLISVDKASELSNSQEKQTGAEKCFCPEGYPLPSCGPGCELGYRMVNKTCAKCDCNNHAETCDPITGECSECLHNTMGPNCNLCAPGFYGDPSQGNYNDCKPCACPLLVPSQNYSPKCITTDSGKDYICTECAHPFAGNKCERCKDGWFGYPSILGGKCSKCECSDNVDISQPDYCNTFTGQCKCTGNVTGWRCDKCAEYFWGDVQSNDCKPCDCFTNGSLSLDCDKQTGQCKCKSNYIGTKCNICAFGYSNLELDCPGCVCNKTGSKTSVCDPETGECLCKTGVNGKKCDQCSIGYFNFSEQGCSKCMCHEIGSESSNCNQETGECACREFVAGLKCDKCEDGYWSFNSKQGCRPCDCDVFGSLSKECDQFNGQCKCKNGVEGRACDTCKLGFVGFSDNGCQLCEVCENPNQVCNQITGKCECPFNKTGINCSQCPFETYVFGIYKECKPCQCNSFGSLDNQCDPLTGQCTCLSHFGGKNCDQCIFGYHGFPHCEPCNCYESGTLTQSCQENGICQCDHEGQCPCKSNTMGKKCDKCKENTFSLISSNPFGCFSCFCFERSNKCEQANYIWNNQRYPAQQAYFDAKKGHQLQKLLGFNVVPFSNQSKVFKRNDTNYQAIYWQLPNLFSADKVNSYNGYLRFHLTVKHLSPSNHILLNQYPLIVIHGNDRITLYHFTKSLTSPKVSFSDLYNVYLHESQWFTPDNLNFPVSRKHLMIALQKVKKILIRASIEANLEFSRLTDVDLSVAVKPKTYFSSSVLSVGIESCECPPQFSGLSCQNPSTGYFRKNQSSCADLPNLIDLIGWSEPCFCNNYSSICDPETGQCLNCSHNTAGPYCDRCAFGYYGDPLNGIPCVSCKCPLNGHSFANKCEVVSEDLHLCIDCQKGYAGSRCEVCDDGYFGDPQKMEFCRPCNCNPNGSLSFICDKTNGHCNCREGFHGSDCRLCRSSYVLSHNVCQNCDNPCINTLREVAVQMSHQLEQCNPRDLRNASSVRLNYIAKRLSRYQTYITEHRKLINNLLKVTSNLTQNVDIYALVNRMLLKFKEVSLHASLLSNQSLSIQSKATKDLILYQNYEQEVLRVIDVLNQCMVNSILNKEQLIKLIKKAEQILGRIQMIDFSQTHERANYEQNESKQLYSQVVNSLFVLSSLQPSVNLSSFLTFLNQTQAQVNRLQDYLQAAVTQNKANQLEMLNLNKLFKQLEANLKSNQETFKQANFEIDKAHSQLVLAFANQDNVTALIEEKNIDNLIQLLQKEWQLNSQLVSNSNQLLIKPCEGHGLQLNQTLENYDQILRPSLILSQQAVKVKADFDRTTDLIEKSQSALQFALNLNLKKYEIDSSLTSVKNRAQHLALIDEKTRHINKLEDRWIRLNETWSRVERKVAEQSEKAKQIQKLSRDLGKKLNFLSRSIQDTISFANKFHAGLKKNEEDSFVEKMIYQIKTELQPMLKKLKSRYQIEDVSLAVNKTLVIFKACYNKQKNFKINKIDHQIEHINSKIDKLKNSILLARQKASEIRISLTTAVNSPCKRSYFVETEPSTYNSIAMTYATKDNYNHSRLFFISNPDSMHFLAVEMVNRSIRFLWNLGSGTCTLEHPLQIQTNDESLSDDSRWYLIKAYRINNFASLSVQSVADYREEDEMAVTTSSYSNKTIIVLKSGLHLIIGGAAENDFASSVLKSENFSGCLYDVYFDDKYVGLWNFRTNNGCQACTEGATVSVENVYQFDGNSYSKLRQISRYNNNKYDVALTFKSLDENSLIFFAPNLKSNHSVAIFFLNGKIVYHLNFGSGQLLELESNERYNNDTWVKLLAGFEIDSDGLIALLKVNDEEIIKRMTQTREALNLESSNIYFGGLSPDFNLINWPVIIYTKFLGCMRDVQIDSTPLDLMDNDYFGIVEGCKNRFWRSVHFRGKGSLELKGHSLKNFETFSFTFKTRQKRSLLYLSLFKNKSVSLPICFQCITMMKQLFNLF